MASSSSSNDRWNYDVFLSFRGADTRNTFTGHLYQALRDKGVNVFIDNELRRGEVITSQLLRVIEESRISIVLLSENYASSSFCLDELAKIHDCRLSKGHIVFPVFYHVDPTDVEEQTGTFGQEFAKLEAHLNNHSTNWKLFRAKAASFLRYVLTNPSMTWPIVDNLDEQRNKDEEDTSHVERVQKWILALTDVARLSGWHLQKGDHESNIIQNIVKKVLKKLVYTPLHVAKHLVGLPSRVEYILWKLKMQSHDVRMIGLHGMGGVGKTTIAKAVYNRCNSEFEFDGSCFLLNVRENSRKHDLAQLQEALLFEILGDQKHLVGNFDKGTSLIKRRLSGKKVLVVIDDVDHIKQLELLAGGLEWFGAGSRIIITTRDIHLLKLHGVTLVHEIKKLGDDDALELFSWCAFRQSCPSETYMELSHRMLKYAHGLPLALKVLGSSLYGRSVPQWEGVLKKLQRCPDNEINDILKVSYDSLNKEEKDIFLDIACFLKGKNRDQVINFLDACHVSADLSLQRLIEKSLVYVAYEEILMHDLLEAMGTQIALDEASCNSPGRRLCILYDIPCTFFEKKGSYDIEGILLDIQGEQEVPLGLLENLTKLRLLIIRNGRISGIPKKLPNSIRWLEWHECRLKIIPQGFIPDKLVVLEMPSSSIMSFENTKSKEKRFESLTHMNFSGCKHLKKTADFSAVPNLKLLNLRCCRKLKTIGKSVETLQKLEILYLDHCSSLTSLPNLEETQHLGFLSLRGCSKLDKLPNLSGSLKILEMSGTAIKEITSYIGNLNNLQFFLLSDCNNLVKISDSIYKLPRLQFLTLSNCSKLGKLPEPENSMISSCMFPNLGTLDLKGCTLVEVNFLNIIGCFPLLSVLNFSKNNISNFHFSFDTAVCHDLDLSENSFVTLPACISRYKGLKSLCLDNCKWLVDIPELPSTVAMLCANNCKSLERFSQFLNLFEAVFTDCHKLVEKGMQRWTRVILQNLSLISMKKNPWSSYRITLPGNEIPRWFRYTREGNTSSFSLPRPVVNKNFIGIAWCAIFEINPELDIWAPNFQNHFLMNGVNLTYKERFYKLVPSLESEHMWLCFYNDSHLHDLLQADEILCEFDCDPNGAVVYKRFGIHFIYKEDDEIWPRILSTRS